MSMTYAEAMEGHEVSFSEVVHEYRKHGLDEDDLVRDLGRRDNYDSAEVLIALGW